MRLVGLWLAKPTLDSRTYPNIFTRSAGYLHKIFVRVPPPSLAPFTAKGCLPRSTPGFREDRCLLNKSSCVPRLLYCSCRETRVPFSPLFFFSPWDINHGHPRTRSSLPLLCPTTQPICPVFQSRRWGLESTRAKVENSSLAPRSPTGIPYRFHCHHLFSRDSSTRCFVLGTFLNDLFNAPEKRISRRE